MILECWIEKRCNGTDSQGRDFFEADVYYELPDELITTHMVEARPAFVLLAAAKVADCKCTIAERESGHLSGCWLPDLQDAIAEFATAQQETQE